MTRKRSKDNIIMFKKLIALDTIAGFDGSLVSLIFSINWLVSLKVFIHCCEDKASAINSTRY